MYFLIRLLLLLGCVLPHYLQAWNATGHMVVAEIARQHIRPEVREDAERYLQVFNKFYPDTSSFITAACWADELRDHGLSAFSQWHYVVLPYDPQNFLTQEDLKVIAASMKNNNVMWAIRECVDTLQDDGAGPFEIGFMLRFLLHFVADIHQPMHCTTLYSAAFPEGDTGGNLFKLNVPQKNLHKYWDFGADLLPMLEMPLNDSGYETVQQLAKEFQTAFPIDKATANLEPRIATWASESYQTAIEVCYNIKEGSTPNQEYIDKAHQVTMERITLAGYRLAYLLDQLF